MFMGAYLASNRSHTPHNRQISYPHSSILDISLNGTFLIQY